MIHTKSAGERIFDIVNVFMMFCLAIIFIYPVLNIFNMSISTSASSGALSLRLIPDWPLSFNAYIGLLKNNLFLTAFANSLFRTITATFLTVLFTFCGAYVLSKKALPFRRIIIVFIMFTMFFSGGLIPMYLLIKDLGLIGSRWSLILPSLTSAWYILIARNFLATIPSAFEEAAVVDGADIFTVMFRIILPMSKPIIAVIALWSAISHWNAWYDAMLYTNNNKLIVMSLLLRRYLIDSSREEIGTITQSLASTTAETVKAATIIVAIIPIACAYPLFQRYFIKGINIGAIKA